MAALWTTHDVTGGSCVRAIYPWDIYVTDTELYCTGLCIFFLFNTGKLFATHLHSPE
jgi:hypothetical protein